MEFSIDKVKELITDTENNVSIVGAMSNEIVNTYTEHLDEVMTNINREVIMKNNTNDEILQKYFLELSNVMYFISSRSEFLGLFDDISKSNAKLAYNEAFAQNQAKAELEGKKSKPTVAENQIYAENNTINETLTNNIYSRSFKIVKAKVDAGWEMLKTLSKVLGARAYQKDYSDKFTAAANFNDNAF